MNLLFLFFFKFQEWTNAEIINRSTFPIDLFKLIIKEKSADINAKNEDGDKNMDAKSRTEADTLFTGSQTQKSCCYFNWLPLHLLTGDQPVHNLTDYSSLCDGLCSIIRLG